MSGQAIDCIPAFREPAPRLELLDELHVHRALVFPTLANLLEYTLDGDPDARTPPSTPSINGCSTCGASTIGAASSPRP